MSDRAACCCLSIDIVDKSAGAHVKMAADLDKIITVTIDGHEAWRAPIGVTRACFSTYGLFGKATERAPEHTPVFTRPWLLWKDTRDIVVDGPPGWRVHFGCDWVGWHQFVAWVDTPKASS